MAGRNSGWGCYGKRHDGDKYYRAHAYDVALVKHSNSQPF